MIKRSEGKFKTGNRLKQPRGAFLGSDFTRCICVAQCPDRQRQMVVWLAGEERLQSYALLTVYRDLFHRFTKDTVAATRGAGYGDNFRRHVYRRLIGALAQRALITSAYNCGTHKTSGFIPSGP